MPAPSGERATLSRDLADFLIELSIALHKHAMYPEGHPSLGPASERGARGAQLWVGLARAALTAQAGDDRPTPTEPAVIARAIDEHPRSDAAAYDQVIVGYLLQIADELKTAGSAEAVALRRRTSRLIRALKPETLQRLVEMGGDFVQRRQFVYDSTDGMAVDAVLDIVQAAADSSHQTISHSLVRMLSKLEIGR